jgi:hypothetical protein
MNELHQKRKRNAEYMRLYRQRKKADTSSADERIRNAERNRLYHKRKKAGAVTTSSISDAVSSHSIAAANQSGESITYDSAEPSTSMGSDEQKNNNNTTVQQENATEVENEVTAIYKYSDATFNLISRIVTDATADRSRMRGDETFHGNVACAYVRDERGYRARWANSMGCSHLTSLDLRVRCATDCGSRAT